MRTIKYRSRFMLWVMASMLCLLAAGCGGGGSGGSGQSPILGFDNGIATVAPAVTAVSPAAGSVGVPVTTTIITAAFNKAMDPASLNKASFTLACPGTAPLLDGVVSYNPMGNVAVLTLPGSANLPASTVCTATVTSAVKDTFGITLASNFTWLFTTGLAPDTIAPTVTSTNIANGATDVSLNTSVSASFSEPLNAVTVNRSSFTLKQGLVPVAGSVSYAGVTAVFTPDSALTLNTVYTATIQGGAQNGVKDLAGNPMVNDYVWTWTTSTGLDPNAGRDTT
ncbi:MAG: Ig-like domain-containing protein, partial [Candidatus Saccharibacteria bacterium]|nr:Ig-like domain-containing protein [Rhodoferax sp.]